VTEGKLENPESADGERRQTGRDDARRLCGIGLCQHLFEREVVNGRVAQSETIDVRAEARLDPRLEIRQRQRRAIEGSLELLDQELRFREVLFDDVPENAVLGSRTSRGFRHSPDLS
jgi:hypothetical protein